MEQELAKGTAGVVGMFLQYGLLGTLCLVMAWVIWKRETYWTGCITSRDATIAKLQEDRLADQKACSLQHVDMMGRQFETNAKVGTALEGMNRMLDKFTVKA